LIEVEGKVAESRPVDRPLLGHERVYAGHDARPRTKGYHILGHQFSRCRVIQILEAAFHDMEPFPNALLCVLTLEHRPAPSLDHLVGAREQHGRHREAERFGGRQVDDRIELRGGAQDACVLSQ